MFTTSRAALPHAEARAYIRKLGLKNQKEWNIFRKSNICAPRWTPFPRRLSCQNPLRLLLGGYDLRIRAQKRRPRLSRITRETAAFKESGRQDLNLRPLGPKS